MLAKLPSVFKEVLLLKVDFWSSRRFLVNIFVKYRDYKVRQIRIISCNRFEEYKVRQYWITNYTKFWITKWTKILKNGLQSAMGLKSVTSLDYKFWWDYKARRVTKWYSTAPNQMFFKLRNASGLKVTKKDILICEVRHVVLMVKRKDLLQYLAFCF